MYKSKRYVIKKITKKDDSVQYGLYYKPWTFMWFLMGGFVMQGDIYDTLDGAKDRVKGLDSWFDLVQVKRTERVT